ncbi:hypothetical protein FACS189419_06430 [Planctomycetales bacterium]|nr:hypothetical protein FACS189419_06430 [Planctomycetales bacterium]
MRTCNFFILTALLLFCTFPFSEVTGDEVIDRADVVRIAHRIADKYQANLGKVMTWRGTVDEAEEQTLFDEEGQGTTVHYGKTTFFIADFVKGDFFTKTECTECYKLHPDGRRELLVKPSAAVFLKDGVYHEFYTYQRPPGDGGYPFYRRIDIGKQYDDSSELDYLFFYPHLRSLPYPHFNRQSYPSYWQSFKLARDSSGGDAKLFREGDVVTYVSTFQNIKSTRSVDLSKGGALLDFHHTVEGSGFSQDLIWHCEIQEIDGIWVPSYTEWTRNEISMRRIDKWRVRWREQKLNEPVRDDEMTLLTLGARQTDLVEDYRTGTLYNIEGDEYPPSLEEQMVLDMAARKKAGFDYVRYSLITLGGMMIVAGLLLEYYRRKKKK